MGESAELEDIMSYNAIGHGKAVIDPNLTEYQAQSLIRKSVQKAEKSDGYFRAPDYEIVKDSKKNLVVTLDTEGNYFEEDIKMFLDLLVPFITSGMVSYVGQGADNWRFVFKPDELIWEEQCGVVFGIEDYTDDELIKELNKRGYVGYITTKGLYSQNTEINVASEVYLNRVDESSPVE